MPALSIQVPFPVFQDRDGQPLENGYIWIGEPNLNPQTNPVPIYYDKEMTIAAVQPLRTLNGYISRAGTPAQVFIFGVTFSILVQDSKGSMVYNFPNGMNVDASYDFLASAVADQFSGTGSQTVFTLTGSPGSQAALKVSVDGLTFVPNVDYTWSGGATLTFIAAPILGAQILVQYAIAVQQDSNVFTTLLVSQPVAASNDVGTLRVSRIAGYTGGTPGFVNSAIRADTAVSAGATAFEWAITGVMDNSALAGENVGGYFQGLRRSTGPTWGAVTEVIDYSGGDPTTGAVSLEVDVSANGTDATNNRLGIDIVVRKQVSSGAACVAGFGIRMQNVSDATSGFTVGIDLSQCTYFQAAIKLAQTQPIAFNQAASRQLSHNGSEFLFRNPAGPVNYWKLKDDFTLLANDVQLIGTRKTGWGVATNGSKAALNGSTATLAQTSAAVAQLIIDLTAHGLIGA